MCKLYVYLLVQGGSFANKSPTTTQFPTTRNVYGNKQSAVWSAVNLELKNRQKIAKVTSSSFFFCFVLAIFKFDDRFCSSKHLIYERVEEVDISWILSIERHTMAGIGILSDTGNLKYLWFKFTFRLVIYNIFVFTCKVSLFKGIFITWSSSDSF